MRHIVTLDDGRAERGTITYDHIPLTLPSGATRYFLDPEGKMQTSFTYSCEPEDILSPELILEIANAISQGVGIGRVGHYRWRI